MLGACTMLGFGKKSELQKRTEALAQLRSLFLMLRGELQHGGTPLAEAFGEISERVQPPFREGLQTAVLLMRQRDGKGLEEIFEECFMQTVKESGLYREDKKRFCRMMGRLGYLDLQMQVKTVELALEELEQEYTAAQEEYRSRGRLYCCMGVMCGLFLTVIFL